MMMYMNEMYNIKNILIFMQAGDNINAKVSSWEFSGETTSLLISI